MIKIPTKSAGSFSLPVLGLGTWQMGGGYERDSANDDERDMIAIREAIKLGITHIDTAELYARGHAEELVGEAIKVFDRRHLFITSKVRWEHLRYDEVVRACQTSLKRLGTSYLDLYLIHGPNLEVPLAKTMRAMDALLEQELVRNIGVSNFDVPLLKEAQAATKYKIVNNQIHYSLSARAYEDNGTLDYCRKHNILVTAYRPLGKGKLIEEEPALLEEMTKKYKKTAAQICLAWLASKSNVVTIFKSTNLNHIKENLGTLSFKILPADIKLLDEKFVRGETINVGLHPVAPPDISVI